MRTPPHLARRVIFWVVGLLGGAMLMAAGCAGSLDRPDRFTQAIGTGDGGPGGDGSAEPPAIDVETEIFAVGCGTAACHGGPNAGGGLDLVTEGVASRILGATSALCANELIVDPNDPAASLLMKKLMPDVTCGSPMPLGGAPLSAEELDAIQAYIDTVIAGGQS